jgi:AcrR family transcriptional regulator
LHWPIPFATGRRGHFIDHPLNFQAEIPGPKLAGPGLLRRNTPPSPDAPGGGACDDRGRGRTRDRQTMKKKSPAAIGRRPTALRILDASEGLFAEHGYEGVSLRDIARVADVEVALVSYHFGPKQELFRHVIARRSAAHATRVLAALEQEELASPSGVPSLERIIYAFCSSTFELAKLPNSGWKRYLQLIARTAMSPVNTPALKPLNSAYGPVIRRYCAAFKAAIPAIQDAELHTAFYWLQSIVQRMLAETGILDRQSRGLCRSGDYDTHLVRIVPFAAAGIRALAPGPRPARSARGARPAAQARRR